MSLTPEEIAIIKSTVPLLETGGVALTAHFYKLMFSEESIVRPYFNMAHQHDLSQPRALAFSVLCVAKNIDQIGAMLASDDGKKLIDTIVLKHVAIHVLPEHYPIVGKYLLQSIREVLGAEVATDAVIDAWGKTYGVLADLLIGLEKDLYEKLANTPGGWRGRREFELIKKEYENEEKTAVSYYLKAKDGQPVLIPEPGQYLTLRILDEEAKIDTTRNYSLSDVVGTDENGIENIYRITTQVIPGGVVSNYLHDKKNVGDSIFAHTPTGEFTLREHSTTSDDPVVFIAAGSGITPFFTMAKAARKARPDQPIHFIYVSNNPGKQLFVKELEQLKADLNLNLVIHHSDGKAVFVVDGEESKPSELYIDLLKEHVSADNVKDQNIYVVGPKPFMLTTHQALQAIGHGGKKVNYEFFGPHSFFNQ